MKIFKQDIKSKIEAWYLGLELSSFQPECDLFVNPSNKYLYDKIIIVTELNFSYERFVNKNIIISRYPLPITDYILIPYIVSSEFSIIEPFIPEPNILYPTSITDENCIISNKKLKFRNYYMSVEGDNYKGFLTQTGLIASILGII